MSATVRRVLSVIAALALAAAFLLPMLIATQPTEGEDAQLSLLSSITALTDAGGGPFEGQARLTGLVIGVYVLVLIVTIVIAVVVAVAPTRWRALFALRIASVVTLVGCAGAALLVVILAVHFEGRSLWFSPAVAAATVGGVLALLATRLPAETPGTA